MRSSVKNNLFVILGYLLLTLLMTYPLVLHLTDSIPGIAEDGPIHVWHLWWFKYSIFNLHQNPLITNYVFWPQTVNTVFDAHTFTNAIISLPLQYLFGLILASNLIVITSLTLSGFGAYLLTRYILHNSPASFIGGIIFAFPPYIFAHLLDGHTNLITTWPIPFYVLFLLKSFETKRRRDAILAGIFLGLLSLNDFTYTAFSLIFTLLILAYKLFSNWRSFISIRLISNLIIIFVVWFMVFSPLAIPAIQAFLSGFRPGVPLWVQDRYGADILWLLKPSPLHPLLGRLVPIPKLGIIESTVNLGWSVMILSIVGSAIILLSKAEKTFKLWVFLAISTLVLTLGPSLHVNGASFWESGPMKIMLPLPYILVHYIPFIGGTQEPARLAIFLMLVLSVLTVYGVGKVTQRLGRTSKYVAYFLVAGVVLFEFAAIPFPLHKIEVPEVYNTIAKDIGEFAVMDMPIGMNNNVETIGYTVLGDLQYFQTIHHHPITRGTVARLDHQNFEFYRNTPEFDFFVHPSGCQYTYSAEKLAAIRSFLSDNKIKYVIISSKLFPSDIELDLNCIASVLNYENFYEKDEVTAFRWISQ